MLNGSALRKNLASEKRAAARFFVSTPVTFTWDSAHGPETAEGITRDVSSQGLFVWSHDLPPLGAAVHCCVFLPGASRKSLSIRFDITGPLIRNEMPPPEHHVFGFVILSHDKPHIDFFEPTL
jgi:hypothetical protein